MLTENEVVEFVCSYLCDNGYLINQKLSTTQTGVDIIATNSSGVSCYIEAKGATSSKAESLRFGKEFNQSQVKTHVGMALVAAFKVLNEFPESLSMVALPNNVRHKNLIDTMRLPILNSGINILLVSENGLVEKYV